MTVTPPTPTPPEGWEERTEWGRKWITGDVVDWVPDGMTARVRTMYESKPMTRRVWVEPWREAE